jgi:hypothetical protein
MSSTDNTAREACKDCRMESEVEGKLTVANKNKMKTDSICLIAAQVALSMLRGASHLQCHVERSGEVPLIADETGRDRTRCTLQTRSYGSVFAK